MNNTCVWLWKRIYLITSFFSFVTSWVEEPELPSRSVTVYFVYCLSKVLCGKIPQIKFSKNNIDTQSGTAIVVAKINSSPQRVSRELLKYRSKTLIFGSVELSVCHYIQLLNFFSLVKFKTLMAIQNGWWILAMFTWYFKFDVLQETIWILM